MSKLTFAAALAVLFSGIGLAVAQSNEHTSEHAENQRAENQQPQQYRANYRSDTEKNHAAQSHRASEIIGMKVMSNNDESIGDVEDLVLDAKTGEIRYAAISVGGFLGMGDKLVAVPWQSLNCEKDQQGDPQLTLNTSREKLKNAPGFDQDNWPDFANEKWTRENDRHYDSRAIRTR